MGLKTISCNLKFDPSLFAFENSREKFLEIFSTKKKTKPEDHFVEYFKLRLVVKP